MWAPCPTLRFHGITCSCAPTRARNSLKTISGKRGSPGWWWPPAPRACTKKPSGPPASAPASTPSAPSTWSASANRFPGSPRMMRKPRAKPRPWSPQGCCGWSISTISPRPRFRCAPTPWWWEAALPACRHPWISPARVSRCTWWNGSPPWADTCCSTTKPSPPWTAPPVSVRRKWFPWVRNPISSCFPTAK